MSEKISASDVIRYEYRPDLRRAQGVRLLTKEEVEGKQGFISVYGFDDDTQGYIGEIRGTYGLGGRHLFSDLLYIDVDNSVAVAERVKDRLIELGLTFEMFESGSPESYHFHIPTNPMYMEYLNILHKQWVMENFGEGLDLSIYKPSGIIRVEGSFHKKYPGKRKRCVLLHDGDTLDLTEFTVKLQNKPLRIRMVDTEYDSGDYLNMVANTMNNPVGKGDRNNQIYRVSFLCFKAGMTLDETIDKIAYWNNEMIDPPVKLPELINTIKSAFR